MAVFGIECVREKHRVGVTLPHLLRADVDVLFVRINVEEKLRRVEDFVDCLHGVFAPDDREKCDRVEYKKKRTGHPKKVAHHKVRRPGRLEFGEAVEYVECVLAFLLNYVVNIDRKSLESVRQGNVDGFDFRTWFDERFVRCESEVNDVSFIFFCLSDVGLHEKPEFA